MNQGGWRSSRKRNMLMDQLRQSKYFSQQWRDKYMKSNITKRFKKECEVARYFSGTVSLDAYSCASAT